MNESPASIVFDINGNPIGVSGSMVLPTGAIGTLLAAIDSNNFVRYLTTFSGSLNITGSVGLNPTPVITANTATTGSAGLAVGNASYAPLFVSVTSSLPVSISQQVGVNNFPATQNVSGTVGAVVENWPATLGVSASFPLQVYSEGPLGVTASAAFHTWDGGVQGISASFPLSVFNAGTVGVSGTVTSIVGNWPATVGVSASFPLSVWNAGTVGISGTVGVNNFPATQNVSGTVGAVIQNWPATIGVSASAALPVFSQGTLGVSGTVGVNNFPGTQNVSGTITVGGFSANVTASVQGAPGGIPLQIWSAGTIGVSGTLTTTAGVTQTAQNVSSSSGVRVWNDSPVGVTGSVNVYTSGLQGVSGSVTVGGWGTNVTGTIQGGLGAIPVAVFELGTVGVSGTVAISNTEISVNNFPATQNISGTVGAVVQNWPATIGVSASFPLQIWSAGTIGVSGTLSTTPGITQTAQNVSSSSGVRVFNDSPVGVTGSVNVYTSGPQAVSGTVGAIINNWPATMGVSASFPLQVWEAGTVGVSGSVSVTGQVSVNNFPATQNVSGSVGAVIQNWPATIGVSASVALRTWDGGTQGVSGNVSVAYQANVTGSTYITSTGSLPVAVVGTVPVSIAQQISVDNFPATQNISGTVTSIVGNWPATLGVSASFPLSVFNAGTVGVSGTVGVNNFPATQAVSGTVSAIIGNWPATLGVSASFPLQVWSEGSVGVTGSVSLSGTGSVWVSNAITVQGNAKVVGVGGVGTNITTNPVLVAGASPSNQVSIAQFDQFGSLLVSLSSSVSVLGVSGTVGVNNFPATQNVSGSVNVTTTGSMGMQVGNASYDPLFITGSIDVTNLYTGLPALATGIAQSAPSNIQDTIGFTVSLTGSLSASNGQVLPLKSDYQGNLAMREQYIPLAEDNINGVIAITKLPTVSQQYTWSVASTTTSLVSASQVKSSAGVVRSAYGRLDTSAGTGNYYLHLYNALTGVAAGVTGPMLIAPQKLVHTNGTDNTFSIDFTSEGIFFGSGLQVAVSTAEFTYTAAGSVLNLTVLYK